MNEPLLDERIRNGMLLSESKKILENINLKIITNGDLLTIANIEVMYEAGLNALSISCYDEDVLDKARYFRTIFPDIHVINFTEGGKNDLKYNRAGSIKNTIATKSENPNKCQMPFFQTVIGWDGEVRLCCHDALNKIKI